MLTSEGFLTLSFGRSSVYGEAQPWQASCESLQRGNSKSQGVTAGAGCGMVRSLVTCTR